MPDVVRALVRQEEAERGRHELDHVVEAPRARRAPEGFEFGEGEFDRIEVGTVRRKKAQLRADGFDRDPDGRLFVDDEIVEDDHITRPQRRHQDLFDIREKGRIVDRAIEHGRRVQAIGPQRRDHGVGLPMTARSVIAEADAPKTPAIAAQQIRRDAGFVEKDILCRLAHVLTGTPLAPSRRDVSAALFVGVYRFF